MKMIQQKRKHAVRIRIGIQFLLLSVILFVITFGNTLFASITLQQVHIGIGCLILGITGLIIGVIGVYFEAEYPDEESR